jgi:hypothetical protein
MDGVHSISGPKRRAGSGHGRVRRVAVSVLAAASMFLATASINAGLALPAHAATTNRAAVVVEVDGVIHTAKVTFSADSVSGLDALRSAGFDPLVRVFGGNGGAVCALLVGGTTIGCPADGTCLTCAGANYWAYYRALAGATSYTYSVAGAGNTQVHDGDVEAWAWGTGSPPSPFVSFRDVWGPDPPTTTRPPVTTRPTTPTTPTTRAPSPTTSPTDVNGSGTATTSAPVSVPPAPGSAEGTRPGTRTTFRPSTTTAAPAPSTTAPVTTNDRHADPTGDSRKVATAPVVARGGGGSPYGLIGFAVILAALLAAIFFAHRRRSIANDAAR